MSGRGRGRRSRQGAVTRSAAGRKRRATDGIEVDHNDALLQQDPGNVENRANRVIDFEDILRTSLETLPMPITRSAKASKAASHTIGLAARANTSKDAGTETPVWDFPEHGPLNGGDDQTGQKDVQISNQTSRTMFPPRTNAIDQFRQQFNPTSPPAAPRRREAPGVFNYTNPGLDYNNNTMESNNMYRSGFTEMLRLTEDDITLHVPAPLKQQIASGEYVNLALLLKGAVELTNLWNWGGVLRLSEDGLLETQQKECKDKIPSIEKWTDAFIIYASIYLSTHVEKINELLHYMWIIRECAAFQGGDVWRHYDEQFRLRQAQVPSSWAKINNDLWQRSIQRANAQSQASATATRAQSQVCHDFNRGQCHRINCRFAHTCFECTGRHALIDCNPRDGRGPQYPRDGRAPQYPEHNTQNFSPFAQHATRSWSSAYS